MRGIGMSCCGEERISDCGEAKRGGGVEGGCSDKEVGFCMSELEEDLERESKSLSR
jgi:hypothetical protein